MEKSKSPLKRLLGSDILLSCLLASTLIFIYTKVESLGTNFDNFNTISYQSKPAQLKFGFNSNDYHIETTKIKKGDVLGSLLYFEGLSSEMISKVEAKSKQISFGASSLRAGKNVHFIKQDECGAPIAAVYEPNPREYVLYEFADDVNVKLVQKEVHTCTEIQSGLIESTLWNAFKKSQMDTRVIDDMEDALASNVDFYHTKKGDKFKLVYEKNYIDGKYIGAGQLLAAYYKNDNGEFYSVYYKRGQYKGYYDYEGRPSKAGFLKAPVQKVRISSGFNMARFHPIRQITIPHLGTDYAAPYGTPIIAVADGVVEAASYTGGNGRFVKLKHDKTYQTQYLHMQAYAKGIKPGVRVRQGQTIGYVGSTGLATGPHVCFRFWKNGKQINHQRHNFDRPEPMNRSELPRFFQHRNELKKVIDGIDEYIKPSYASIK